MEDNPAGVIENLRKEIAQKDETISALKDKTKEFATKLKTFFQQEKDEKDAQYNKVIPIFPDAGRFPLFLFAFR
jgi:uncharacterized protein (DUF3084 family)